MRAQGISPGGTKLLAWATVPVPFATIAVMLRFVSRRGARNTGPDDWVMLLALVIFYGFYATTIVWVAIGHVGWPQDELDDAQLERFLKMFFVIQIFYTAVSPTIKVAIILLYRRLFAVIRPFERATTLVGLLCVGWFVGDVVAVLCTCLPVGSFWHPAAPSRCIDAQVFLRGQGLANFFLDVIVLVMPAPVIWSLRMSVRSKILLSMVFVLGVFVCVASVFRVESVWNIDLGDVTASAVTPAIWSTVEPGFSIVAGCLPTLPPVFMKWRSTEGWKLVSLVKHKDWSGRPPSRTEKTTPPTADRGLRDPAVTE